MLAIQISACITSEGIGKAGVTKRRPCAELGAGAGLRCGKRVEPHHGQIRPKNRAQAFDESARGLANDMTHIRLAFYPIRSGPSTSQETTRGSSVHITNFHGLRPLPQHQSVPKLARI